MAQTSSCSVLLVDDDKVSATVVSKLLERAGYRVEQAFDAAQALSLLQGPRFDLALLDNMLPDGDGIDVTRRLREWSGFHHDLPRPSARCYLSRVSFTFTKEIVERTIVSHPTSRRGMFTTSN